MATGADFRKIAYARLKTARILIAAEDWDGAAYLMGYTLEVALKSAACKSLRLDEYPDQNHNKALTAVFKSHKFDQLLMISGQTDIFSVAGPPEIGVNWSQFVQEYPGDWVGMRYDPATSVKFDKIKVTQLYENLYEDKNSIIKTLTKKKRW